MFTTQNAPLCFAAVIFAVMCILGAVITALMLKEIEEKRDKAFKILCFLAFVYNGVFILLKEFNIIAVNQIIFAVITLMYPLNIYAVIRED